jgi:hypothetical protein
LGKENRDRAKIRAHLEMKKAQERHKFIRPAAIRMEELTMQLKALHYPSAINTEELSGRCALAASTAFKYLGMAACVNNCVIKKDKPGKYSRELIIADTKTCIRANHAMGCWVRLPQHERHDRIIPKDRRSPPPHQCHTSTYSRAPCCHTVVSACLVVFAVLAWDLHISSGFGPFCNRCNSVAKIGV